MVLVGMCKCARVGAIAPGGAFTQGAFENTHLSRITWLPAPHVKQVLTKRHIKYLQLFVRVEKYTTGHTAYLKTLYVLDSKLFIMSREFKTTQNASEPTSLPISPSNYINRFQQSRAP